MNPKRPIQVLAIFALLFGLAFAQSSGSRESLAADKLEIMELAARFENTFDAGDIEGHLATWADEMSFASPFGNYDSKDAYGEWVTAFLDVARASGGTRHLVTNHEIFVEGDEARMTAYLIILTQNPPAVAFTAVFSDDRLTRTERVGASCTAPFNSIKTCPTRTRNSSPRPVPRTRPPSDSQADKACGTLWHK